MQAWEPQTRPIIFYGAIALLIIITIIIIVVVARKSSKVASPSTVKTTIRDRVAILNDAIEPLAHSKKSMYDMPLPEDQSLLLNYQVQGCRLAGYLGPLQDGTFAEEDAIRLGLTSGSRLFIVEISNGGNGRPVLIARDGRGYKRSLNDGSIRKVFSALASNTNKGDDPLIIVLYFHDAPNKTKDPAAYLNFLSQVAKSLEPIIPFHLGLTSVGDFTRQKKESELFTFAPEFYKNKVLILCNADTSAFRDPAAIGVKRTFSPNEDLDFLVHCRLYKHEAGGDLGLTTVSTASTSPKAVICDDTYFLLTPPDKVEAAVNTTRNVFTIVMKKDPSYVPTDEVVTRLFDQFGIHSIPLGLDVTNLSEFKDTSYKKKEVALRFTKPKPIVPTIPNKQLNANGGVVIAPKL